MSSDAIAPDTQAVLLLCGTFANQSAAEAKPLTPTEYNALASWLGKQSRRPADLLPADAVLYSTGEADLPPVERVRALLGRGFQMATAVDHWQRLGLWVLSRGEKEYPERLRRNLRAAAPPLLFGAGELARLDLGGLAVVGSRDIDEEGLAFARRVGERCAVAGMQVISGGARGVDQAAVAAALEAEGGAVVVLSDRLDRVATSREAKGLLREGRLTLVTPFEPEASFAIGRAMGRNKLIYTLADQALVARFSAGEGGTWAGALEQLNRIRTGVSQIPVYVRVQGNPEDGLRELQNKGAAPFAEENFFSGDVREALTLAVPVAPVAPVAPVPVDAKVKLDYADGLPLLLQQLQQPVGVKQLPRIAKQLEIAQKQLQEWLKRAVTEGKVSKKKQGRFFVYVDAALPENASLFDRDGAVA